jgi:uncharacterized protein YjiS (DUF1127 family)
MTTLTMPIPSGRGTGSRRSGILQFLNDFADGLREGLELARRYDTLSSMSDTELARLGLRRKDIPQAALAGRGH